MPDIDIGGIEEWYHHQVERMLRLLPVDVYKGYDLWSVVENSDIIRQMDEIDPESALAFPY